MLSQWGLENTFLDRTRRKFTARLLQILIGQGDKAKFTARLLQILGNLCEFFTALKAHI